MHVKKLPELITSAEYLSDDSAGDCSAVRADTTTARIPLIQAVRVLAAELLVIRATRHHKVVPVFVRVRLQGGVAGGAAVQLTLGRLRVETEAGTVPIFVTERAAVAAARYHQRITSDTCVGSQVAVSPGCFHTGLCRAGQQQHHQPQAEQADCAARRTAQLLTLSPKPSG